MSAPILFKAGTVWPSFLDRYLYKNSGRGRSVIHLCTSSNGYDYTALCGMHPSLLSDAVFSLPGDDGVLEFDKKVCAKCYRAAHEEVKP